LQNTQSGISLEALLDQMQTSTKKGYRKSWAVNVFYNLMEIDGHIEGYIAECAGPRNFSKHRSIEFGRFRKDGGAA